MTTKTKLIIGAVALLIAFGVWKKLTLVPIPVGELCDGSGGCSDECLAFGDLLPDYSHKEICTKQCDNNSDCPAPTHCEKISVVSAPTNGDKAEFSEQGYCMPTQTSQSAE